MDDTLIRDLLDRTIGDEPAMGPVVERALTAGHRMRRRRRIVGAVSVFGSGMLAAVIVMTSGFTVGSAPEPSALGTVHARPVPSAVGPSAGPGTPTPVPSGAPAAAFVTLHSAALRLVFALDVYKGNAQPRQPLILFRLNKYDRGQDFIVSATRPVSGYFQARVLPAGADQNYGGDQAEEFQYAPAGSPSGLCMGVSAPFARSTVVVLEPCGAGARTLWIAAGVLLISGANTSWTNPYVLTYPASAFPTDIPRPVLRIQPLGHPGLPGQRWIITPRSSVS